MKDGPCRVRGWPPLVQQCIASDAKGVSWTFCEVPSFELADPAALCRCGQSVNKPFCDGSHAATKWRDGLLAQLGATEF